MAELPGPQDGAHSNLTAALPTNILLSPAAPTAIPPPLAGPLKKGLCSYSSFPHLFGSGAHIISLHTLDLQGGWGVEITVTPAKLGSLLIPLVKGMWGHIRKAAQSKAKGQHPGKAGGRAPPTGRSYRGGAEGRGRKRGYTVPISSTLCRHGHPLLWIPSEGRLERDCWASET